MVVRSETTPVSEVVSPFEFWQPSLRRLASLVNQTSPSAALDVLHHQHIQRCGGSGLVYETTIYIYTINVE